MLADHCAYLAEKKPRVIIDTATLTGACMVALGEDIAGAMGNDGALMRDVLAAGEAVGEPEWELPLWAGYRRQIESPLADVKNVGEPVGRRHHGRAVPGGVRGRDAVGAPRRRGTGLPRAAGRPRATGCHRRAGAHAGALRPDEGQGDPPDVGRGG